MHRRCYFLLLLLQLLLSWLLAVRDYMVIGGWCGLKVLHPELLQ